MGDDWFLHCHFWKERGDKTKPPNDSFSASPPLKSLIFLCMQNPSENKRKMSFVFFPSFFLVQFWSHSLRFAQKNSTHIPKVDEDEVYWRQEKDDEELEWTHKSTPVILQFVQCFTNAMVGQRSTIGGLFTRSNNKRTKKFSDYPLSPLQEQRLQKLHERLQMPFDETSTDHQEALRALWNAAFPNVFLKGLISEQWKEMGWQGSNPSTDFRLLFKEDGMRATWEYPFAAAGINVTFMLIQMLDLSSAKPRCLPGINFVKLLEEDEAAFDVLYCIAFEMMDAQWLAMRASYMEFNEVLQATRTQLERELSLEDIHQMQDLPAYNLLYN
ncbi:ELMO domain-containing protein A-like isoform X3 [Tripterygium wilfordii]|uniref:ELMO domain-containing protein A-like isoform X3 n=1 Tax=Tripterygium wilfordii TaxID=458696 RepID=UPI0018F81CF3|nr:ELMO domain-containing protein A-like isoform X3 [Tripterygium wilfordii]